MGCSPSKVDNKQVSPIAPVVVASPIKGDEGKALPTSGEEGTGKVKGGRNLSSGGQNRKRSVSPSPKNDFYGTIPLNILIQKLKAFHDEVESAGGNFKETVEYFIEILNDLVNDYESSQYRAIKKGSGKFHEAIGKHEQGLQFVKCLGFREVDEELKIDEKITVKNLENRVKQIEITMRKEYSIQLSNIKGSS